MGKIQVDQLESGAVTVDVASLGTLVAEQATALATMQNQVDQLTKNFDKRIATAWVVFNSAVVTGNKCQIIESYNIKDVDPMTSGGFKANFATPMTSRYLAISDGVTVSVSGKIAYTSVGNYDVNTGQSMDHVYASCQNSDGTNGNPSYITLIIFGGKN